MIDDEHPSVLSAFHATFDGRFALLALLVDDDSHSIITRLDKVVTDTAAGLLAKLYLK